MESSILLTILIPTYNRSSRVKALLSYLIPIVEAQRGRIEIVVSNNKSTDGTEKAIANLKSPYLRVENREAHLQTAEENIFNSIDLCRGEYIWFHGDDDIPNRDTIDFAVGLLESGSHDFLVFNSQVIDDEGTPTGGWLANMNSDILVTDFIKGACAFGLISSFAGISNAIQRKSVLMSVDWRDVIKHSPIYSHVAIWLMAFSGKKLTIVNRPLIYYRVDLDSKTGDHFRLVAARMDVPDYFFWTFGIMQLFQYLESNGIISRLDIFGIFEFRRDGSCFRLLDNLASLLFSQSKISRVSAEGRNKVASENIDTICDWLLSIDPGYLELVRLIKNAHISSTANEKFYRLLASRERHNNPMIGLVAQRFHYSIYRHLSGFVAFDKRMKIDKMHYLRSLDFDPADVTILHAADEATLLEIIDEVAGRESQIGRSLLIERNVAKFFEPPECPVLLEHQSASPRSQKPVSSPEVKLVNLVGMKMPPRAALEFGKFLCTIGLKQSGARFYNSGATRIRP